jgi:hypothetical protein
MALGKCLANFEENLIDRFVGVRAYQHALLALKDRSNDLSKGLRLAAAWWTPDISDRCRQGASQRLLLRWIQVRCSNLGNRCRIRGWPCLADHSIGERSIDLQVPFLNLFDLLFERFEESRGVNQKQRLLDLRTNILPQSQ